MSQRSLSASNVSLADLAVPRSLRKTFSFFVHPKRPDVVRVLCPSKHDHPVVGPLPQLDLEPLLEGRVLDNIAGHAIGEDLEPEMGEGFVETVLQAQRVGLG